MMSQFLTIEFHSDWHCGTGRGSAAHLDGVIARDAAGLPYAPGRTIRGVLREAVRLSGLYGHVSEQAERILFGDPGFDATPGGVRPVRGTRPGRLEIADARMDADISQFIRRLDEGGPSERERAERLRATLVRLVAMTAVDRDTGAAKAKSLRLIEVAVPLRLSAKLDVTTSVSTAHGLDDDQRRIVDNWREILADALVFVDGIGAHRTRGLGRCTLSISEGAAS